MRLRVVREKWQDQPCQVVERLLLYGDHADQRVDRDSEATQCLHIRAVSTVGYEVLDLIAGEFEVLLKRLVGGGKGHANLVSHLWS